MMSVEECVEKRFGLPTDVGRSLGDNEALERILARRSRRRFTDEPVAEDLVAALFATAFSAPSKSDLQQVSVIRVADREKQAAIAHLSPSTAWAAEAPLFMVWCGDSRRIRRLAEWRGHPFANDHLDAFMNAAVDAGIAMETFVLAAESMGLGCCPVSQVRDRIWELSDLLALPRHVFPVAGLCVGWPADEGRLSLRLPLEVTVHTDVYDDGELVQQVADYDRRREAIEQTPLDEQRMVDTFGASADYGWSENRTRQYSVPARADFGRYVRSQGFDLT